MNWWSFIGTLTVAQVVTSERGSSSINDVNVTEVNSSKQFLDLVLGTKNKSEQHCGLAPPEGEWKRPVCKLGVGCDVLLHCYNYSSYSELKTGQVMKVTPMNLEKILENRSINNTCAVVMFYVPYCPYSVEFARTFNALGRSFKQLPILAVDFTENDPYKYLAVYVPLVNFYYRGKVIYRFSAVESFNELVEQVSLMTNFTAMEVNLTDPENEFPVPTVRADGDKWYLIGAAIWITFVATVHLCTMAKVKLWLSRVTVRLKDCIKIIIVLLFLGIIF